MDAKTGRELSGIKSELSSVIKEMESIIAVINKECQGIGSEKCVNSLNSVLEKYRSAKKKLDRLNTEKVRDGFSGK